MLNKVLITCIFTLLFYACSGPHTPFGPIHSLKPHKAGIEAQVTLTKPLQNPSKRQSHYKSEQGDLLVSMSPGQITYHKSSELELNIMTRHRMPDLKHLRLNYEGRDITQTMLQQAQVSFQSGDQLILHFDNIRFPAKQANKIFFSFDESISESKLHLEYMQPGCPFTEIKPVQHINPFQSNFEFVQYINEYGKANQINPSLVAGLIAQESSFNPKAISWAKAIGLTQITPLAADEIQKTFRDWPRHPSISKTPVPILKYQIIRGHLTPEDDFRLNPSHSIQGGIEFLKHLKSYWDAPRNHKLLSKLTDNDPYIQNKLMIASYNFGPARVRLAVVESEHNWVKNQRTLGARYYYNRIQSFCHDFSLPPG